MTDNPRYPTLDEARLRNHLQHVCSVAEMAAEEIEALLKGNANGIIAPPGTHTRLALIASGLREAVERATAQPVFVPRDWREQPD